MHNKAQIGETITWIVATVIILFVLGGFIFISSGLSKLKSANPVKIISEIYGSNDFNLKHPEIKTSLAYSLNNNNKDKIDSWLTEEKDEK